MLVTGSTLMDLRGIGPVDAAQILADVGDDGGVPDLRREQHQRMPSSATDAQLKTAASSSGAWTDEQAVAREVLGARDFAGLVDALPADGDIDAALAAATDVDTEDDR